VLTDNNTINLQYSKIHKRMHSVKVAIGPTTLSSKSPDILIKNVEIFKTIIGRDESYIRAPVHKCWRELSLKRQVYLRNTYDR
jgi:hypothetical protein